MNNKVIDILILCGGKGERLKPAVSDRPKAMADINGIPFLNIMMNFVSKQIPSRFILCCGYMKEYLQWYYDKENSYEIILSEENKPLGTGGAVKKAMKLVKSDICLIMNGDTFCNMMLNDFISYHKNSNALATIVVNKTENSARYGCVLFDINSNIIKNFSEKSQRQGAAYINAGVYCFNTNIQDLFPKREVFSLEKDLFPKMCKNLFYAYTIKEKSYDIGTPESYKNFIVMRRKNRASK
jgi:D-glycero-alpha-D-manno-heptose 1-phosphate guanylyltransferase